MELANDKMEYVSLMCAQFGNNKIRKYLINNLSYQSKTTREIIFKLLLDSTPD